MSSPKELAEIDSLFERHRQVLDRLNSSQLRATARQFNRGCGRGAGGTGRCLGLWLCRLTLCLVAASAGLAVLSRQLISGGYATQSTEWLAALNLAQEKLLRRVSHALRIYDTEAAMNMGRCLLPSPFGGGPHERAVFCCGCEPIQVVRLRANLTSAAVLIDSLYSRSVSPFVLTLPGPTAPASAPRAADFARLSAHVTEHRDNFRLGGHSIQDLPLYPLSPAVQLRFDDLFPPNHHTRASISNVENGRVTMWSFSHLPAVRALRRLVPRPTFLGQRTERLQKVNLLIAGAPDPVAEVYRSAGDFPEMRALAYAEPLSGRWRVRLAAKPACCRKADATSVVLELGQAMFFPTDCYNMMVVLLDSAGAEAGALMYIGFI